MKFCDPSHIHCLPAHNDENTPPNPITSLPDKPVAPSLSEEQHYRLEVQAYILSHSQAPSQPHNYFHLQLDLNQYMRGVLLCWLQEVHQKYRLMPETFFLTVKIIDGYLRLEKVVRTRLQLVGVAALWIASKYQETYQVPKLSNLENLCDNTYKANDILAMEGRILQVLGFDILAQPSPLVHLEIINHHAKLQLRDYWLARYLLEASTYELAIQRFSPALLAYSVVYFLKKMRGYSSYEEEILKGTMGGAEADIRIIGRELCSLWHRAEQQDCLAPLRSKFAHKQFFEVSKIRLAEKSR